MFRIWKYYVLEVVGMKVEAKIRLFRFKVGSKGGGGGEVSESFWLLFIG